MGPTAEILIKNKKHEDNSPNMNSVNNPFKSIKELLEAIEASNVPKMSWCHIQKHLGMWTKPILYGLHSGWQLGQTVYEAGFPENAIYRQM